MITTPKLHSVPLALGAALLTGSLFQAHAAPSDGSLQTRTQSRVQSLLKTASHQASDLQLTPAQKTKLRSLAQKNAPLLRVIWSDKTLSKGAKMSKARALENEAKAILTTAQKQKLSTARREAMGKLFETALWVSQELDLTEKQQGQLKSIALDSYRKSSGSGGNIGALRGLIVDTSGRIDKVLTPAQQSKWLIMKSTARQELVRQTRSLRQMTRA
jgi:hypothetical protein